MRFDSRERVNHVKPGYYIYHFLNIIQGVEEPEAL
jgi:hypothetical protein